MDVCMPNRSRVIPLAPYKYILSIAHVNNVQELLVAYDKKIEIMGGNVNEYTQLYIYNYSLYCETLKLWEKIEYLIKKWNYEAAEGIILRIIKMNTHSYLTCSFNNTEKLSFTRWVYLWSDKYMERRLCFALTNIIIFKNQEQYFSLNNFNFFFFSFSLLHQPVLHGTMILIIDITLLIIPFFITCACQHSEDYVQSILYMVLKL